ncbi:MAG TPA: hypothetical protein PKA28_04795 [Methylomusa anaerophila]|uniref:Uncharacterized protein n=1 Tax=Methylomusa anaerophila TaxID=1930071 RepID=A0A348AME0_9FIRM|nr:hypothetical protein [Methylomusa anaerophila]BBB92238.1 hypothetical protein MAMMFC1_02923 [Methylomusa anaerophila]HML87747.1 hypothetical protein [Methylomusa anaerophila]
MIREEYLFEDIADYLYKSNDLLIAGMPSTEERSSFFKNLWTDRCKSVLLLKRLDDGNMFFQLCCGKDVVQQNTVDLCIATSRLLRYLNVDEKNVLLDMSSLDHVLIMFFTKQFLTQVVPKTLFAAYIRPKQYSQQSGNVGFSLCDQVLAVNSVPGFAKRESGKQTLCSFLGFEGIRLKSILESVHNVDKFIPVVAFPSGAPQWYNVTMWNSMDTLQSENRDYAIRKCFSESIFEAVNLLQQNILHDEKVVLAPLGTRAHSMACC